MSRIEHLAFWTEDLERLADFYGKYFGAIAGDKYVNPTKGFESRFLNFEGGAREGGARIEVMKTSTLSPVKHERGAQRMGLAHLAVSVGSAQSVDRLTNRLKQDGFEIVDGPRHTGDGYYESVVLDPDGNRVEITV
jgi:lactoylglutathione lyase